MAGSFTEKLDPESLQAFNVASKKSFSEQAQFFLNAFWVEFGDQAESIYSVSWNIMKKADMTWKGTQYIHLYEEGNELDFDMSLHFFELLCKFYDDPANAKWAADKKSAPVDMTSIARKKELRDTVDINFDGKMSFLEFLLYQYHASPKELMSRSAGNSLPQEVLDAMRALEEVNKKVRAYEQEKQRLTDASQGTGIKALAAKNELAQLNSSPLWETLNAALITAEAKVRIAKRKYGVTGEVGGNTEGMRTSGTLWWLERELQEKQRLYGKK
jgi:hypothetical protein